MKLLERQEVYRKQRVKQHWLQEGDRNTHFFHRFASTRKRNNRLERIKDTNGIWQETPEEVQQVIEKYFEDLFTASKFDGQLSEREKVKQVTENDNVELLMPVTNDEVKEDVFAMHPDKACGPDGLNPTFFQVFWSIIEKDVVHFFRDFMQAGELPEGVNEAVVFLIPKDKEPKSMGDLRPISLCNVLVRILPKVIANRMKKCLGSIISDKQSAFLEGKLLTDNALIAFEINHYMKRKTQGKEGLAGLKIDISKAYDRLEWVFIHSMMIKFGFSDVWIERLMKFISLVSYSFLHNGEEFGCVIPKRGIRQGDPISPYIYIMCVEDLSLIIRCNDECGLIHGCKIARRAPAISHLLFADDCYLFFKATEGEASTMKNILQRYANVSGQIINFNKSAITFSSNTKWENRAVVCEKLGVHESIDPGKYLGMPMRIGKNNHSMFTFLVHCVDQKLQTWSVQSISKAGKVTLLKTAAQSILKFWMSLLLILGEICDKIEKSMNAYWWEGGKEKRGIRWMFWERICEVKEAGGLGFRKLCDFNVAMLAKQAWRLINNSNPLVTEIMKANYYAQTDLLNAKLGTNPSYMWRSILASQEVIRYGCRRKIGNGNDTNVWNSLWLPCEINGYMTSPRYSGREDGLVSGLMSENSNSWDEDIISELCNEQDRNLIQQIPLPSINRGDSWYWLLDSKGDFTVRSFYRKMRGESCGQEDGFWKKLWNLQLPGKILNFLWRACHNVLSTAVELARKQVDVNVMCPWYHEKYKHAARMTAESSKCRERGKVGYQQPRNWCKPPQGWIKNNIDAAFEVRLEK